MKRERQTNGLEDSGKIGDKATGHYGRIINPRFVSGELIDGKETKEEIVDRPTFFLCGVSRPSP